MILTSCINTFEHEEKKLIKFIIKGHAKYTSCFYC